MTQYSAKEFVKTVREASDHTMLNKPGKESEDDVVAPLAGAQASTSQVATAEGIAEVQDPKDRSMMSGGTSHSLGWIQARFTRQALSCPFCFFPPTACAFPLNKGIPCAHHDPPPGAPKRFQTGSVLGSFWRLVSSMFLLVRIFFVLCWLVSGSRFLSYKKQ